MLRAAGDVRAGVAERRRCQISYTAPAVAASTAPA